MRTDIFIHRTQDAQNYAGYFGIQMRVKPGREKELGVHLSGAEKRAAKEWSNLSRQMNMFSRREQAEAKATEYASRYPHMEYRVVTL